MKDIDILREARRRIESEKDWYICCSVSGVVSDWSGLAYSCRHPLRSWIERMLGEPEDYREWLRKHHRKTFRIMGSNDFRQGRLQWLDAMIEYLDKCGGNLPE